MLLFIFLWRCVGGPFWHLGYPAFSPRLSFFLQGVLCLCHLYPSASPFLFSHLRRRSTLRFVAAGLLCASFFAPAFHSRSAVCGRKRDDAPGRPRSHRVWGSLHACRGRDPAAYVPSPFLRHGGTGAGKADTPHGNGRLRIQAAQTGQHHNGNTHCQGQRLKNDRDDLVKREAILFYNLEAARLSRLSSQIFQRFGII